MLVEAIHLLCNKKDDRQFIRGRAFDAIRYYDFLNRKEYIRYPPWASQIRDGAWSWKVTLRTEIVAYFKIASENNRAIQQLIDLLIGDDPDVSELSKVEGKGLTTVHIFTKVQSYKWIFHDLKPKVPDELKEKLEQTDKEELERIEKYKRGELEEEDAAGIVMMKWYKRGRSEDIFCSSLFLKTNINRVHRNWTTI